MFFVSWKTVFKLSRHLPDTSLTLGYLSSFQTFSYCNLNGSSTARWIDRESSWTLDSFSIAGGSIELLFCVFTSFLDTSSTTASVNVVFSTPSSTDVLTPLDTFICWELPKLYILGCRDPVLISSISLDLSALVHLLNLSLSLQTSFPSVFQAFSRISLHLVSFNSLIFMHFILWNLSFWDSCKIWGFLKSKRFLCNFWDGFWRFTLKNFMHCIPCAL